MNIFKNIINKLANKLVATSDLSKSLVGFDDGRTYYFNINKDNAYSEHYTLYRGIDLLASLGSGLPVNIYKGDNIIPHDTPLPNSFNIYKPNPYMSLNELHYNALVYFFYRGEYMIEIIEEPYLHLMEINPQSMRRTQNGLNWLYDDGRNRKTILSDNLIYVKLFNPDKNGRGLSPLDVVQRDLQNEREAVNYNTSFFKNFGQVGGIFYDEENKIQPDKMNDIIKDFNKLRSGSQKAYKAFGTPYGVRYKEMQQTMQEMQYLESRKDIRDIILSTLGIHKSLFGVTDQVNRSVSEEATRMLWLHRLKPAMLRIQEAWQRQLFQRIYPLYTYRYDFSEVAELKQTIETIDKRATLLKNLGYTTNEINESLKLGMEEINNPALNIRCIPNNLIPFSEMYNNSDEQASLDFTLFNSNDNKKEELLQEYFKSDSLEEFKSSSSYKKHRYINTINKLMSTTENKMSGNLGKFFANELKDIIKIVLGNQKASSDINESLILSEILNKINSNKDKLSERIKPIYEQASIEADKVAIGYLGHNIEATVADEIVDNMTNKIKDISNYTYKLIRNQIKTGIGAGETVSEISDRIKSIYKFNRARSRTIARTESAAIIDRSTDRRYRESGATKKEWINTGGKDSRDSHNSNASMGKVDYDYIYPNGQRFPNDGNGGAGENVNCRCTFVCSLE